ncbi:uncharacterized protein LOC126297813 isoform X1 [Schistocerca gregaria]|uniref:uncharacterized protein LOC126297813 isoform X1 n=2 Tax=Schistocerca gregaria TaxID=7010 RepID=UPI00211EAC4B|nr:uncharacterized protein LOC126297813 isoform X1 [Schistocerca gregaria]
MASINNPSVGIYSNGGADPGSGKNVPKSAAESGSVRKPSYLGLSCSVSGYGRASAYGLRSRDHSPAPTSVQPRLSTPVQAMDGAVCDGRSSTRVNGHVQNSDDPDCSHPIMAVPGAVRVIELELATQQKGFVQHQQEPDSPAKSVVQQRVERLYGPGALAQAFLKRMSGSVPKSPTIDDDSQVSPSENDIKVVCSSSPPALPVLRHLRPEFRAQLPIGRTRRVPPPTPQESELAGSTSEQQPPPDLRPAAPDVVLPRPTLTPHESTIRDGHFFLKQVHQEVERLLSLVRKTESELENNEKLNEEAKGKLRAAAGQAGLLVRQKLQQFEGLCQKNITQSSDEQFPTTNEDLEGFWDMVKLQVDHVDRLFEDIERLRAANWIEEQPTVVKGATQRRRGTQRKSNLTTTARSADSSGTVEAIRKARDDARRKMMEDRRRAAAAAARACQQQDDAPVQIFQ